MKKENKKHWWQQSAKNTGRDVVDLTSVSFCYLYPGGHWRRV